MNFDILIPARRNSKGLPFKNRTLLEQTLNIIPYEYKNNIIISTDDEWIIAYCIDNKIRYFLRSIDTSRDEATTKEMVVELIKKDIFKNKDVIMLYLTYPERKWLDVENILKVYKEENCKSLLCKKEVKQHPYLMMVEYKNSGYQVVNHNLCRRQDYPPVFEISHYICIFNIEHVNKLKDNMYLDNFTYFYQINKAIDIDTAKDLEEYYNENKNNC